HASPVPPHFVSHRSLDPPHLHSFPTRRSSDLRPPSSPSTKRSASSRPPSPTCPSSSGRIARSSPSGTRRCRWGTIATRASSRTPDRKSTRLNSSHVKISYAVFCLKKKKKRRDL